MAARLFFSYSHADEDLRDILQKHLASLKHQGLIETWHDRRILAGDVFAREIDHALEAADVILLLISSDFLASGYCYDIEMQRALERNAAGEARVIPVILRPCDWHDTPFGKLMAVPRDGKPIKSWPDIDDGMLNAVQGIKAAIGSMSRTISRPVVTRPPAASSSTSTINIRSSNLSVRREFSDREREDFLEEAYVFIRTFFEGSLQELQARHHGITTRFRKIDENRFTAILYKSESAVSRCKVTLGGMFGRSITYSMDDQAGDNSCNESLSVECDDQRMFLKSMGMWHAGRKQDQKLTLEGAAELYWAMLIQPIQ